MRINVDRTKCQGHAQCTITAPEIFNIIKGNLEYTKEPPATDQPDAEVAADVCPAQAITIQN